MSLVIRVTDFAAPELDVYARTTENQMPDMFRSRS